MIHETVAMRRLDEWLKLVELPELAKACIENFVLSCDQIGPLDEFNFINIDIRNFPEDVQARLVAGLYYAYTGQRHIDYMCFNGVFYQISSN